MASETQAAKPCLDLSRYELTLHGRPVRLERQPMELLILFVQRRGQLVTREDIVKKLWGKDVFVDVDGSINHAIRKIRAALRDDPDHPRFLETVVGKGYRFIGEIEVAGAAATGIEALPGRAGPKDTSAQAPAPNRRRLMIVSFTILVLIAAATWGWLRWRARSGARAGQIRSVAVLPLENLSGDPAQEYFADGMTDALIANLAQINELKVISRTSVMQYKRTRKPLPEIARALGVDAVVEGTVVHSEGRIRITAQLIDGPTDRHLWAESFEGSANDVLSIQDQVARAIAGRVRGKLGPELRQATIAGKPVNPDAYEDYLRGLFFWNKWTEDGVRKSVDYFQQSIQKDPNYAPAYAGLANSYISMGDFGVGILPPHQANAGAERAALKAIALDETLADGHAALALSRFRVGGDLGSAEKEFKRAIELNTGSATAHHWYSHYLLAMGRNEEAITEGERALDLSPVDPEMGVHMQFLYLHLHRYDDVIKQGSKTLELDPNFSEIHFMNGQAYELKQMYKEAHSELQSAVDLSRRRTMLLAALGHLLAVSGDRRGAESMLKELDALSRRRYVPAYEKVLVEVGLGDDEAAIGYLKKAYDEGSYWMFILQTDARLDPLRSDPRFQDLVGRVAVDK